LDQFIVLFKVNNPEIILPSKFLSQKPIMISSSITRMFRLVQLKKMQVRSTQIRCLSSKPDFRLETSEKHFDYMRLETQIYSWWNSSGYFKPASHNSPLDKQPYVIPMPPPNVTGYLHMGHAMFVSIQDIMARFQRMRGRPTLWLPGTDHAGIATQLLVERQLLSEGTSRQEIGREAFLDRVWLWKAEKGTYITEQMKRLGASADWTRERFTLEPLMCTAVTEAFCILYERGLIYRGNYPINWSPNLQTSISDLEVEYFEEEGTMYTFKYPLVPIDSVNMEVDATCYIPVSTTRPETILGDAAVCVHPDDARFQQYIGRTVQVPGTNRHIPVIGDTYVDREFGTGALKVTPAHDHNDYEIGLRHNLPVINIMDKRAHIDISDSNDPDLAIYNGMDRYECREALWNNMKKQDLVISEEPHVHRVPRSQRGGDVVEPTISTQWFVNTKHMAAEATSAVKDGHIEIIPPRFENTWYRWLAEGNIRPWCVSRQLWWGHRIPAYYATVSNTEGGKSQEEVIVARSEDAAWTIARDRFPGCEVELRQEDDVLDTWFR
jgi:valyl-tRNA synthetase